MFKYKSDQKQQPSFWAVRILSTGIAGISPLTVFVHEGQAQLFAPLMKSGDHAETCHCVMKLDVLDLESLAVK